MAPVIASFGADPAIVSAGQSFALTWNVTGATAISIDQGIGVVTGSSKAVTAAAGVTYTLTATNASGSKTASTTVTVAAPVAVGSNPILYVTQTPVSGFASRTTTFGNHLASPTAVPRGGDLMIRYPDGSTRNLTQEAGFGSAGFQGANAIAVREPSVHWSGSKALFSMVVGSPATQYEVRQYQWQVYEVSGLEKGATARIAKIARQPAYNNVSPFYGSDERVLFTSDRPRGGEAHLYPQLDEYESFPIVTGIWSLDPASGNLFLLNHTVSGAFSPSVDSFGRVIFTRWDHLQQDQQADADRANPASPPNGAFLYADESAAAARKALADEVFPEPRLDNHPSNVANHANGHTFNHFMPWQVNEDGTSEETLNHVGRHEIGPSYIPRAFNNDPSLLEFSRESVFANRTLLRSDGGLFHLREDPLQPGTYYGSNVREFGTAGANQIVRFTGSPTLNAETMIVTAVTHPDTAGFTAEGGTPAASHSGMYRNPLPMADGALVAVHTAETRLDQNEGTRAAPRYRYQFRLKSMKPSGVHFVADRALTAGTRKALWYWDPDARVDFDGILWELDPVEVMPRAKPSRRSDALEAPERAVLLEENVDEAQLRAWLTSNDLALIVTRDNTSRDRGERQQPFNLQVPGGVSKKGDNGKVYDISHLQLFQADQIRGYGGVNAPREGRRPLAQTMHDPKVKNPTGTGGPAGSVKLGLDGSSAAFVPARRAMTWQLTDAAGKAVVRERNWLTFQPGEIRTCASCHGLNSKDQAGGFTPLNKPEALRKLMQHWKQLPK
ncbi:hypothetical protein [Massilia sp. CF038]|uniref:HzsA-related protein n=1 Tax=Massilia sp. CF038 TaxID=1881045 RepID=UPI0009130AFA|nr:hypothetical protein [Massilia sp. CF038]SHG72254.1 hypothetical protein SAMN05428948_1763 [Massilia sp. CF038]